MPEECKECCPCKCKKNPLVEAITNIKEEDGKMRTIHLYKLGNKRHFTISCTDKDGKTVQKERWINVDDEEKEEFDQKFTNPAPKEEKPELIEEKEEKEEKEEMPMMPDPEETLLA